MKQPDAQDMAEDTNLRAMLGTRVQPARAVTDPELRAAVAEKLSGIQDALADLTAELHDAMTMVAQCDGEQDGEPCILNWHAGPHRSATGVEWLEA